MEKNNFLLALKCPKCDKGFDKIMDDNDKPVDLDRLSPLYETDFLICQNGDQIMLKDAKGYDPKNAMTGEIHFKTEYVPIQGAPYGQKDYTPTTIATEKKPACHYGTNYVFSDPKTGQKYYAGGDSKGFKRPKNAILIGLTEGVQDQVLMANFYHVKGQQPTIMIEWQDYGIPKMTRDQWLDLLRNIRYLSTHDVSIACMGGHGRTGTALAILGKLSGGIKGKKPIKQVREIYCKQAVETQEQIKYVNMITRGNERIDASKSFGTKAALDKTTSAGISTDNHYADTVDGWIIVYPIPKKNTTYSEFQNSPAGSIAQSNIGQEYVKNDAGKWERYSLTEFTARDENDKYLFLIPLPYKEMTDQEFSDLPQGAYAYDIATEKKYGKTPNGKWRDLGKLTSIALTDLPKAVSMSMKIGD